MTGRLTALGVLLLLILIGQIRIGVQVEYCERGLFVWIKAWAFRIPVFPSKAKEKRPKTKKGSAPASERKKGGALQLVLDLLPVLLEAVKRLRRKLRVDTLDLELTVSATDPADTAMRYGQANALLGALWQPIVQAFHVKDGRARVYVDFDENESAMYILASVTLNIAQLLQLALWFGFKALGTLIRKRGGRKACVNHREVV